MGTKETYEQEKMMREKEKGSVQATGSSKKVIRHIAIWGSVVVAIGLVVLAMIFLVSHYRPGSGNTLLTIPNTLAADDQVKGDKNGKVKLYEYADFQCPACQYYSPVLNQLYTDLDGKFTVIYRYFPLPMHANAKPMAYAAEAAARQGKFWEMHDIIYQNQTKWENERDVKSITVGYAKALGLNTDQFSKDFDSADVKQKIDTAISVGTLIPIGYTPTFFINGKQISNPKNYDEFKKVLSDQINANK